MKYKCLAVVLFSSFLFISNDFIFSQKVKNEQTINLQWIEMGPCNYGGRTRAFIVDRSNPNLIYAGAIAGGLWKSTTGGSSWSKVVNSDLFENLAVSCLYQAHSGDLYFGTGEYFGFDGNLGLKGNGIWKSTDNGNTWTQLPSTNNDDFIYVSKIAGTTNKIYAATFKGLRISTDGGQTWSNPIPNTDPNFDKPATDVEVSNDGSLVVASINNKAYVCNTADDNFVLKTDIPSDVIRLEFAISQSNPSRAYCIAVAQDGKLKNIYETKDKGNTWTAIMPNVTTQFQPFGLSKNKQGRYHCSIAVDPTNEDKIYIGGIDLYYYTPSSNFVQISLSTVPSFSSNYIHENIHNIVFSPNYSTSKTFYVATDGGIFRTTNSGDSWSWIIKNYNTMDFLNVGITSNNEVVGGTVHNGILLNNLNGNTDKHFFKYLSGTVANVQRLSINPNFMIATRTYGRTVRTYQGGSGFSNLAVVDSIPTSGTNSHSFGTSKEPFLAPIRIHEKFYDPNSIFYLEYIAGKKLRLGDTIFIKNPYEIDIYHIIDTSDLGGDTVINKNDTLYIKDYYQVLTALGLNNRVWISWNALVPGKTPSWYPVVSSTNIKKVNTLEFTADGDIIYFADYDSTANKSTVYRLKNIQAARTKTLATYNSPNCVVTSQKLGTFNGKVQGLGIDPQNNENLIVTIADYNPGTKVYYSTNAASTTNDSMEVNFVPKQGNLPEISVYASIVIWNNSQQVMLGTEKGVWFTEDITATNPIWIQQIEGMANVPVSDLRQQLHPNGWLPNNNVVFGGIQTQVTNHGVIYAATRGRGIFRCENFRGPVGICDITQNKPSDILLFPNPASDFTNVQFTLSNVSNLEIKIINLNGQTIYTKNLKGVNSGKQTIELPTSQLKNGIYIVSIKSVDGTYLTKLIKQ